MNAKTIAFWATTGLFSLAMIGGGIAELTQADQMLQVFDHLGYPVYLMTLLGFWKIAGVATLLTPGFDKLKEWAYAGFFFDLSGAAVSHLAAGDGVGSIAPMVVLGSLMVSSYLLRAHRKGPQAATPAVRHAAAA